MSHGHGHDDAHATAHAVGEPTPFLSDPGQFTTTRCKRRFNDLVLLQLDARAPESSSGPKPRFEPVELGKLLRERYLLYASCLESKPGKEPKHAYLYPQAAPPHH